MREINTTFVGLDTHKVSISVAMLIPGEGKPVEWQCTNDRASVRRMVKVDRHHSQGSTPAGLRLTRPSDPIKWGDQLALVVRKRQMPHPTASAPRRPHPGISCEPSRLPSSSASSGC